MRKFIVFILIAVSLYSCKDEDLKIISYHEAGNFFTRMGGELPSFHKSDVIMNNNALYIKLKGTLTVRDTIKAYGYCWKELTNFTEPSTAIFIQGDNADIISETKLPSSTDFVFTSTIRTLTPEKSYELRCFIINNKNDTAYSAKTVKLTTEIIHNEWTVLDPSFFAMNNGIHAVAVPYEYTENGETFRTAIIGGGSPGTGSYYNYVYKVTFSGDIDNPFRVEPWPAQNRMPYCSEAVGFTIPVTDYQALGARLNEIFIGTGVTFGNQVLKSFCRFRYAYKSVAADSYLLPFTEHTANEINRRAGVGFALNGKGYILLGIGESAGKANDEIWEFNYAYEADGNPSTNPWRKLANTSGIQTSALPGVSIKKRYYPISFTVKYPNGSEKGFYGFGEYTDGLGTTTYYNDLFEFTPPKTQADPGVVNPVPVPSNVAKRTKAIAFTIDVKAYIGLGQDENGNLLNDLWMFDPLTGYWERKADFPADTDDNQVTRTGRRAAVGFTCRYYVTTALGRVEKEVGIVGLGEALTPAPAIKYMNFKKYTP